MTATSKEVVRRWLDALAGHDGPASALALIADGFVCHGPDGTKSPEPDERWLREMFDPGAPAPGGRQYCMVAEGDKVAVLGTGINTKRRAACHWLQVFRLHNGKIVETWFSDRIYGIDWGPLPTDAWRSGRENTNKQLLRRWYDEMYRERRFDVLMATLAGPELTRHEPTGSRMTTIAQHVQRLKELYPVGGTAPHPRLTYDLLAEGDKVVVWGTSVGYRDGLGAQVNSWLQLFRVANGRLAETWFPGWIVGVDWTDSITMRP